MFESYSHKPYEFQNNKTSVHVQNFYHFLNKSMNPPCL
jgi:hypothetical protein